MSYYVDWRKPIKVLIMISAVLFAVSLFHYFINEIREALFVAFALWILSSLILFMHFSSSIKIENGKVSHLLFGIVKEEYPIASFTEFKVEAGLYPGKLKFKNGESFSVSGIAIGNNHALARALLDAHDEDQ